MGGQSGSARKRANRAFAEVPIGRVSLPIKLFVSSPVHKLYSCIARLKSMGWEEELCNTTATSPLAKLLETLPLEVTNSSNYPCSQYSNYADVRNQIGKLFDLLW